ncbi:ABC transporter permease [Danxiaibacter flavus]|uniref:ABC transporter permease n=1 Tax=Danxiaibacter flavus TaxID=3049108 RepID=A0ABV3ZPB9_9BACT|nr:ABC transporter permease [Chitinophagaceae bacterium DXS]
MLRSYFKTAIRNLSRHKVYTVINISGLAIGLAAFWLIVLYVGDEISFDRYNENADRIVRVVQHARWAGNEIHEAPTSAPFAPELKEHFPEIEEATRIITEGNGIIKYGDKTIKVDDMVFADKNIFNVFTFPFLYGNAETALASPGSIVITEELATALFGSTANALNQTIYLDNNEPNKITGVIKDIPQNSHLRFRGIRVLAPDYTAGWQNFNLYTYLLLKKGTDYKALETKMPQFAAETIQKLMRIDDYRIELQPLTSIHLHSNLAFEVSANGSIKRIYMFVAIAALILIIAIINYMNLATARSSSRIREVGTRKAIGSGRTALATMFMFESVLVTILAACAAVLLVTVALPFFNTLTGKLLSIWRFGKMNTLVVLAAFSLIVGIVSGLYPSLFLSRFKTIPALKGQMGNMFASIVFRKSLVVFQFVITVVMICGSVIIYRQLNYALKADLGFNKEQVLTFHIDDRNVRNQTAALKAQLMQNPAIENVAMAGNPIGNNDIGGLGYYFETEQGDFATNTTIAEELMIDADYLPAMDIKLLQGRNFSANITSDKYGAAMINETLMNQLGWKNAVGKKLKFRIDDKGTTAERTVVGVIKDFHTYSLQHKVEPMVMLMPPAPSEEDNVYVKIAKGKTAAALDYITKAFQKFDKQNTPQFHFLDANFARQYAAEKKQGEIALIFTVLAVIIACLGLFGLATFTAAQRVKEIGIRKVLGASAASIVQMLSKDFLKLVAIASIIAFPIAWLAMNQWLQGFAYRIDIEWWIFIAAGILVLLIALATIGFQSLRAASANPVESLRNE